jgi:solute carrier family 35 protein E1
LKEIQKSIFDSGLRFLQVGVVFINVPLWITNIRKPPKLTLSDWISLAPIGLFAAGAHGGSVLALGGGSVTFAQIVKACEPVWLCSV